MAFIFGIVNLENKKIQKDEVLTLCEAVGWEHFINETMISESYAMGFCWNPIRKPQAGIYSDERLTVVCNGEIYNSEELKKEISVGSLEQTFANAYQKWGKECANKFDGDFSVVIIDHLLQQVVLFRDHIGTHPLCYTIKNQRLIFASHEFGIAQSHLTTNRMSMKYFISRLSIDNRYNYQQTFFKDIYKVLPGHILSLTCNDVSCAPYWIPEKVNKNEQLTIEQTITTLREKIIGATVKRIKSEEKIGAHLSGGIDSSGITAILADFIDDQTRFKAYSWTPDEKNEGIVGTNEKELIEDFIQKKKINIRFAPFRNPNIPNVVAAPEFETMNIELYTIMMAQEDNVSRIFSGWGGDEFTSISNRGALSHILMHGQLPAFYRWIKHFGIKSTLRNLWNEITPILIPSVFQNREKSVPRERLKLFKRSFKFRHFLPLYFHPKNVFYSWRGRTAFMMNLLRHYHLPERMDSWYLFGEKYGVEYKYPLLDKSLLEFWFSVPTKHTYQTMQHRYLYREALNGILPDMIRNRPNKHEDYLRSFNIYRRNKIIHDIYQEENIYKKMNLNFIKEDKLKKIIDRIYEKDDFRIFFNISHIIRCGILNNKYCSGCKKSHPATQESE